MDNKELIKWAESVVEAIVKGTGPYHAQVSDDTFLKLAQAILLDKKV